MIIKVCGMRDADNIQAVAKTGVDWLGMIFWPRSSRHVADLTAANAIPCGIERVGVFVDQPCGDIVDIAGKCRLNVIQLHGKESRESIMSLRGRLRKGVRLMKAISVGDADDISKATEYEGIVDYLLFDTKCKTVGGSGKQFDWAVLEHYNGSTPFLLSGGIGPDDAEAVSLFSHPLMMGIDLNSRFETAPAYKDVEKISSFINELNKQKE
ncbi:MAG: phosphoribosylanthranilate isomerase [Prevotella sp.]